MIEPDIENNVRAKIARCCDIIQTLSTQMDKTSAAIISHQNYFGHPSRNDLHGMVDAVNTELDMLKDKIDAVQYDLREAKHGA